MIKDLSQSLVAAVAEINKSSRQKYVTELNALNEKMAAKAMKMPKQPEPKADPAAHSDAASMAKKNMKAEAAEGSMPRNEKEKKLAAMTPPANKITHGDVLKGRGVRKEGWEDMLKAAKERRAAEGTGKFDKKTTGTGTVYTRKSSTFDDGGKDADMKKAEKKMKQEAASAGRVRSGEQGMTTRVLHNDGKGNHLSMTHHNEEPGAVTFHGKVHGHKIRFDSEGEHGSDPTKKDITRDLKDAHGDLPKETHALVQKAAHSGVKHLMGEASDTPGNGHAHQCAIHVKSEQFGEGRTLTSQHAEPDADGNIAWYDVMFAEGIKRVNVEDIEILVSENHMNHKKKKGM